MLLPTLQTDTEYIIRLYPKLKRDGRMEVIKEDVGKVGKKGALRETLIL